MSAVYGIAVSGLQATARRLAVSADNVVNAQTSRPVETEGVTPAGVFQPQRVQQTSLPNGGVRAVVQPVNPATRLVADLASPTGVAAYPNVDLAAEIVEQRLAATSYKAILRVIEVQAELDDVLLDLKT